MKIYTGIDAENILHDMLNEEHHEFSSAEKCCGYYYTGYAWLAFDNTTGDCWMEEFETEEEAIRWIKREGEDAN